MNTTTATATTAKPHTANQLLQLAAAHLRRARELDQYARTFRLPLDPSTNAPVFNDEATGHMVDSVASARDTADMAFGACLRLAGLTADDVLALAARR